MNKINIFKSVINANKKLNYRDLMEITGKTEGMVFYWLRFEREIDNLSLILIYESLRLAKMKIPKRLELFVKHYKSKPIEWAYEIIQEEWR